jgi:hypothetical protein
MKRAIRYKRIDIEATATMMGWCATFEIPGDGYVTATPPCKSLSAAISMAKTGIDLHEIGSRP